MVYLSRIYTGSGDDGTTGLGDGTRVSKADPRVNAYGEVDELNAVLGLVLASVADFSEAELLRSIQNDLFDVGADLCLPASAEESRQPRLRITIAQVRRLEHAIDRLNTQLAPLFSFILPGGSLAAAWLHLARTVCRRAERAVVALQQHTTINPHVLAYLNRLSDLLFVLARSANDRGRQEVLWVPGQNCQTSPAQPNGHNSSGEPSMQVPSPGGGKRSAAKPKRQTSSGKSSATKSQRQTLNSVPLATKPKRQTSSGKSSATKSQR
jgi:cob(I)alamin adenosyltransferase